MLCLVFVFSSFSIYPSTPLYNTYSAFNIRPGGHFINFTLHFLEQDKDIKRLDEFRLQMVVLSVRHCYCHIVAEEASRQKR